MLPTRFWAEMSWKDFQSTDMEETIAVLPVAAVEQHGPHLPVRVDAAINAGIVARALDLLPDDLPLLVLSGRVSELDRLRGFDRGCDDYMVKPFAFAYSNACLMMRCTPL